MPLIADIKTISFLFYTIPLLVKTIFRREERWKKDGRCLSDVIGHAHWSPIATSRCKSRSSNSTSTIFWNNSARQNGELDGKKSELSFVSVEGY